MATFGFCGSISPEKSELGEMHYDAVTGNKDSDPNKLLQCPFDKSHKIRAIRLPYHLVKCQKNHPNLAKELQTCPFNASHVMPKHELALHVATCSNRTCVGSLNVSGENLKGRVPVSTWTNPFSNDDWDKETDEDDASLVWVVTTDPDQRMDARTTKKHCPL